MVTKWIGALIVAFSLSGCAVGPGDWVGRWEGRRPISVEPGQDPSVAYTLGRVELTIHEDGTFELLEAGMPKAGRGRYWPDRAELRIETLLGRPVEVVSMDRRLRVVRIERGKDGIVRFFGDEPINASPLVISKSQRPASRERKDVRP
jgi:hypothetical protein